MNISEPFIKRPVMTTLVMAGMLVFGVVAYRSLPVSDLPPVDYPTISVSASVPGASPDDHGGLGGDAAGEAVLHHRRPRGRSPPPASRATPRSRCSSRSTANIDAAASDVQAAITQTIRQLPQNIVPPTYQKVDPSQSPIIVYALTSASLKLSQLDEFGQVNDRPASLDGRGRGPGAGVRLAEVRGAGAARSPGAGGPADRHRRGERRDRAGERQPADRHPLGHRPRLRRAGHGPAAERRGVPSRSWWPGATARPVRLEDLGRVIDSVQDTKAAAWYNGRPRHRPRHLAPARHQHGRGGGPRAEDDAGDRPEPAALGGGDHDLRPLGDDPRVGRAT